MHIALAALLILALLFGPQLWARTLFRRHQHERADIPGTGGELARHLLNRFGLDAVGVEAVEQPDHYDPQARVLRLNTKHHEGRSLAAIAVAAHEVGHALQHARDEPWLNLRTRLVRLAYSAERIGAGAMIVLPLITLLTRSPATTWVMLTLGVASLALSALVHLVTLPVEFDASFGKALPILKRGNYIDSRDESAVRQLLRAAAFTYLAASLASLLNLGRWLMLLRRR